jgi:hypothetical protein
VLVLLILIPLFLAIVQLGFTLYMRNTIAACAQTGARRAAAEDVVARGQAAVVAEAVSDTRSCIDDWGSNAADSDIEVSFTDSIYAVSVDVVKVSVRTPVPIVGLFGLGAQTIHIVGEALQEEP